MNKNVKKLFGTINVGTMSTAYTDLTFTIADSYTIQSGDRIGIRFNGGSSSAGVNVMMDKVTTDAIFDGQNSQRIRGITGGWYTSDVNEDLYMILKQTKP